MQAEARAPTTSTRSPAANNLADAYESLGRWAEAEPLRRDALARRRKTVQPDSPLLAGDLAGLGRNLLKQAKWSEAEPLLRECLAIREKAIARRLARFDAMSLLGGSPAGQGRYAEAEPLVVAGYEGMKAREAQDRRAPAGPACARPPSGWSGCTRRGASPSRPPRGRRSSAWPTCPPTSSPGRERRPAQRRGGFVSPS